MATLIGLCVRTRLGRGVDGRWRLDVRIKGGTHVSERAINKQLGDKERLRAAGENGSLREVVEKCLEIKID